MTTTVIAYFPSPPRGVWHLGPVPIRAYALFIIIGIVAALLIGDRRWEARGGERGVIYDIALWAVPFGLIGGRLYHLATDWRTYFGEGGAGPGAALRIWDGGLGIWGAVALGGVGAWIACRRRGIPLPAFGDAIAPGIVLAQAIGRLGNYFNQELFGRETTMPWGLEIFYRRDPAGFVDVHSLDGASTGQLAMVVQPTFLYELLWNLAVFAALIYLDRRFTIGHGRLFALYVAGYCIGRFGIELLRDDAATHIAGIRINSFTSTFVFIGAVVYLILAPKGREDPATLSGSAADRLRPDSVEEPATAPSPSDASVAIAVDEPVGGPETKEPSVVGATAVESPLVEKPDIKATEAVAAEADLAEVDVPAVEVAGTPEQAATDEPKVEEAAADQPDADAVDVAEVEPPEGESERVEEESVEAADGGPEAEGGPEADEESAEAADGETEAEGGTEAEEELADAGGVESPEGESEKADEEKSVEAADGETEAEGGTEAEEELADAGGVESPEGESERVEEESVEAADGETEAENPDVEAEDKPTESDNDDTAAAEEPASDPTPRADGFNRNTVGWRLRLNSWLRR